MNEAILPLTGGCLCGVIRYEASRAPHQTGYCHCRMCQQSLGNLFGPAAIFKKAHFRFVAGEPVWYASSDVAKRGFCGNCGSPLVYQRNDTDTVAIWIGTLDHPQACQPQAHFYTESRIPWADIQTDLPDMTDQLASYKATQSGID